MYNLRIFREGGISMSLKFSLMFGRRLGIAALVALCAPLLPAATVTVSNPVWGTTDGHNGMSLPISWSADAALTGQVRIELRNQPSTETVKTIASSTANNGHYSWTIPSDVPNAIYRVRVTFLSGGSSGQSQMFWISPWVKLTNPDQGVNNTTWRRDGTYAIAWSWTGPKTDAMTSVDLFLLPTGGGGTQGMIASHVPNSGSYAWKVPANCPLGSFYLCIGEPGTGSSWTRAAVTMAVALIALPPDAKQPVIKK
jgi:hypothetical protein